MRGVVKDDDDDGAGGRGEERHLVDDRGPLLLPAALRVPDHLANLLSAGDGEDFVEGVHRLSARTGSRGIIELPKTLDRAVRVAVRDTGHTHRQIKAKGRSLLDALKSISRGMPSPDADEAAVTEWLMNKGGMKKNQPGSREDADAIALGVGKAFSEGMEWGVRLPIRKQKRLLEGIREDAAAAMAAAAGGSGGAGGGGGGVKRGKGDKKKKKPPAPSEAATNYGPLEAAAYAITRLPMTFGAQQRVFTELKARSPGFVPRTLLDFGAGPAPSLWAARRVFGEDFGAMNEAATWGRGGRAGAGAFNTTTTLVDASPGMMAFTRRVAKIVYDDRDLEDLGAEMGFLSKPSGRPLPDPNPWGDTGPVRTVASLRSLSPKASFDLVVAGYSLGELAVGTRHEQQQQILRGGGSGAKLLSGGSRGGGGGGGGGGGLVMDGSGSGLAVSGEHKTPGQKKVEDTVLTLWSRVAPGGALVLIEPGTPRGSGLVRKARTLVLEAERAAAEKRGKEGNESKKDAAAAADDDGAAVSSSSSSSSVSVVEAHVVAPCQHDRACPMDGLNSWCHFSQRVKRSEMHRQMLPRGRGPQHQDERFSYVIIRRLSREGAAGELAERAAKIAAGDWGHFDEDEDEEGAFGEEEDEEENMDEEEREERRLIRMSIRGSDVTAGEGKKEVNNEERRMMMSMSTRGEEQDQDNKDDDDDDDDDHDEEEDEEDEDTAETLADAVAVASSHKWGRMVRPPLKKSGHVIIDLCTAEGGLNRHIVARSNAWEGGVGKSGYRAARKSKWGDLWPYGDPRRLNELDEDDASLQEFFKDFDGVDMNEVKGVSKQKEERRTPVGVGSARKPFMSKRPKIVGQYVDMEKSGEFDMSDVEDDGEK